MLPLIVPLALASLAPPAFFPDIRPNPWLLPYPTGQVSDQATEVLVGRFSDDPVPDGVLLVGGDLFLLYAPDRICSYSKVTGPFYSMTKVGLVGYPGAEGLLASSDTGLVRVTWDAVARQLSTSLVPNSLGWARARQLQTIGTGSSGKICALSSTGDTALYADWNGTAVSGMGSLGLGHTALSLAGLNWDGDTALDFVFDDGTGLWKKLGTGTPAARIGSVSNYAQPRVLRLPGPFGGGTDAEFDRVIWLTQSDAGPGQMLKVVSSPMGTSEQPIYGGNITAAHLTLADFDADGSEDLLITRSDEHTAFVLFQQHAGSMSLGFFSELTHNALGWDLGAVSGSSPGSPAVGAGDLDGDGDADVLYAGQPGSADVAQVCFANSIDEEEGVGSLVSTVKHVKPWLTYATYVDWMYPHTPPEDDPDEAQLTLEQWTGVVDSAVISANYVRVTVWGRMDDTSDISPVCLQDWFEDCSSSHFTVPIPLPPNPEAGLPQYLVIQVSYVVCDGAPEADHVVQAFPAWTGQFDHTLGIGHPPSAGGGTTGGIDRPPPPPSGTPPSP